MVRKAEGKKINEKEKERIKGKAASSCCKSKEQQRW
jgi:hypothetical protein